MTSWPTVRLGEVVAIRPPKAEARVKVPGGAEVGFVSMSDLDARAGVMSSREVRLLEEVYDNYTYFAEGDVLLAKITPCFENGKIGVVGSVPNGVGFGSSEFMVIRPSDRIDRKFLYHFLSQDWVIQEGVRNMTGSVGHRRVPQDFIEALQIPLPPLNEQKRIVAKLDEAQCLLQKDFEIHFALTEAKEAFAAAINGRLFDLEGTPSIRLCELVASGSTVTYGVVKPGAAGEIPFVRSGDLKDGRVNVEDLRTISKRVHEAYSRTQLHGGEVLVALVGVPGAAAVVPQHLAGANIARQVAMIRTRDCLLPDYLAGWLNSPTGRATLRSVTQGSVQQVINLRDLRDVRIPVPSLSQQSDVCAQAKEVADLVESRARIEVLREQELRKLSNALLIRLLGGAA